MWVESGVCGLRAPSRRGFGTTLIERSVKADGGSAHATYRSDGVTWDIWLTVHERTGSELASRATARSPQGQGQILSTGPKKQAALTGMRFIVIEDEPLVALEIVNALEEAGVEIVGVAGANDQALELVETAVCDGAFLDANLHGNAVDEIASALTRRGTPFAFVSGYGRESLPRAFPRVAVLSKPFEGAEMVKAAQGLIRTSADFTRLIGDSRVPHRVHNVVGTKCGPSAGC